MSEIGEGPVQQEHIVSYTIEGKNGQQYPAKFFRVDGRVGQAPESSLAKLSPQIVEVAKRCFTNWTDDGARFARILSERANRVSVVFDPKGERVVAFNLYEQGQVTPEGVDGPVDFVYTHYAGVEPQATEAGETFRSAGLMEKSRTHDTGAMNPDVISGCTANGAILRGVRTTAKELDRVMYPDPDVAVSAPIVATGRAIYGRVNGDEAALSVDDSLIRHGQSPYVRGSAPDPLVDKLPTQNDAILYASVSKGFAARLHSTPVRR